MFLTRTSSNFERCYNIVHFCLGSSCCVYSNVFFYRYYFRRRGCWRTRSFKLDFDYESLDECVYSLVVVSQGFPQ